MIPVLGLITWALIGVSGLGAATMAFLSAYRRENPARPKAARPPEPPPPPSAGPTDPVDDLPPLPMDPMPTPSAHRIATASSETGSGSGLIAFPKSGFAERAAALALDTIFVLIACGALGLLDDDQPNGFILAMLAYHIGFWAWKGTTFGGIVCQLRLTRTDGTTLRFVDALVRGIASLFSLGVAGLGFLWILKDEDRQGWHDKIAGTYVVSVPKNWPLT
jgi:uncharacterized RDD family membrane protein YckC